MWRGAVLWYSLDYSSEGWKQRAPWHMTSGISDFGLFVLPAKKCRVGVEEVRWR